MLDQRHDFANSAPEPRIRSNMPTGLNDYEHYASLVPRMFVVENRPHMIFIIREAPAVDSGLNLPIRITLSTPKCSCLN